MRQKHSLGQVFLKDKKIIERIINSLDITDKNVCEIGPGQGDISARILEKASYLWCIEIDPRLYKELEDRFSAKDKIKIVNSDILEFSFSGLGKDLVVFGNVPYYISSELIDLVVRDRKYIKKAYFMFQKEFAHKLLAKEKTPKFCFLSCLLQYHASIKKLFDIAPGAFSPHPGVDSSFVEIDFYDDYPLKAKDEKLLFDIIKKSFSQRRKKIINSLDFLKGKEVLLDELGIALSSRPSDVSLSQYVALANALGEGL